VTDEIKKEIPRLSPSIASTLIKRSPLHAWQRHRLLGGEEGRSSAAMEDGKIYEALIFGMFEGVVIIDAKDYRTDKAKEERDAALADKRTPILVSKYVDYSNAADIMAANIRALGVQFTGSNQVRREWNNGLTDCSGVLDHLILGGKALIYDLKCVDDAIPAAIQRKIVDYGYDVQHAAYMEAVEQSYPGRTRFQFIVVEKEPPYAASLVELGASMRQCGEQKWRYASKVWAKCLASNVWPGYSNNELVYIDATPWQMAQIPLEVE